MGRRFARCEGLNRWRKYWLAKWFHHAWYRIKILPCSLLPISKSTPIKEFSRFFAFLHRHTIICVVWRRDYIFVAFLERPVMGWLSKAWLTADFCFIEHFWDLESSLFGTCVPGFRLPGGLAALHYHYRFPSPLRLYSIWYGGVIWRPSAFSFQVSSRDIFPCPGFDFPAARSLCSHALAKMPFSYSFLYYYWGCLSLGIMAPSFIIYPDFTHSSKVNDVMRDYSSWATCGK